MDTRLPVKQASKYEIPRYNVAHLCAFACSICVLPPPDEPFRSDIVHICIFVNESDSLTRRVDVGGDSGYHPCRSRSLAEYHGPRRAGI